jgi:hypothetical protein
MSPAEQSAVMENDGLTISIPMLYASFTQVRPVATAVREPSDRRLLSAFPVGTTHSRR